MFLDFEEIKAANPIGEVAERLELNFNKSSKQMRGKCPVCESSGDRNLSISTDRNVWYCFTLGKGGDQIALVSHIKGIGTKEAAAWIAGAPQTTKEKKAETEHSKGFKPLEYLQHDHEAVLALGIAADDAERLGIGYAVRGVLRGTVAVPVRLADGTLSGYIGLTDIAKLPPSWRF